MKLTRLGSLLLAALAAAPALAQPDPGQIAQTCVHRVTALAQHRVQQNQAIAAHCVQTIAQLLKEGDQAVAHHVAQVCVHRINVRSAMAGHRIQMRCQQCIHVLLNLQAPELAEMVGEACGSAVQAIGASRQAAVQSIVDALGGGGAPEAVSTCPADLDRDGEIGAADLLTLVSALGTSPGRSPDLDGDGVVTEGDLTLLLLAWGTCP